MKQHQFAHTNAQLFNQLIEAGYSERDRAYLFKAYQYATARCVGFQPCGKPFIMHLIRTASILIDLRVSITVIAAGLLHAVYEFGDFGDGSRGISTWKRTQLKQHLGQWLDLYVVKYTELRWNDSTITKIHSNLAQLELLERDVLLIRLANELEQSLDLEVLYRSDYQQKLNQVKFRSKLIVEIAFSLGYPMLSEQLNQSFQAILSVSDLSIYSRNSQLFSHVSHSLSVTYLLKVRLRSYFQKLQVSLSDKRVNS